MELRKAACEGGPVFGRARQAVLNVFYNVDLIKVTVGDGISPPELTAIVEEAHREHLKVADHAIDTASIQTAIEVGADSIEHGNKVTDEQLKQMRDKGIVLDSDAHLVWQLFHEEH